MSISHPNNFFTTRKLKLLIPEKLNLIFIKNTVSLFIHFPLYLTILLHFAIIVVHSPHFARYLKSKAKQKSKRMVQETTSKQAKMERLTTKRPKEIFLNNF